MSVSPRLFVIDDEVSLLMALEYGLRKRGFDVETFEGGEQALEAYRQSPPDLVVLDCRMPGLSGPDTAKAMLQHCHRPIIMLSGMDDAEVVHSTIKLGIASYLVKPMSVSQLAAVIESTLARYSDFVRMERDTSNMEQDKEKNREISVAIGIVMAQQGLSYEQAFEGLRRQARSRQRSLREFAGELVSQLSSAHELSGQCANNTNV